MEVILNIGLGIGALMFIILLTKKDKSQSDFLLIGWILVTLLQVAFYEITIYCFSLYNFWAILSFALPLLGAPVLFLYILAVTGHKVSGKTIISHLSIYPLYVVTFIILYENQDIDIVALFGYLSAINNTPVWMDYYAVPIAFSSAIYCIWNLVLLKKHQIVITSIFSFEEKINLKWVRYIVYLYVTIFVLNFFMIFGALHFQLLEVKSAFALVAICLSLMLVSVAFYGFKQTAIFSNIDVKNVPDLVTEISEFEKTSYSKSGLTSIKMGYIANQLLKHMENEKPFLNEDLNLSVLSKETNIPPPHISQVINMHFRMNFYDFVNQYRVLEAQKMLKSSKFNQLSILGIAFDCGFKSKSSFNRYFKKYTGISPSEFQKN